MNHANRTFVCAATWTALAPIVCFAQSLTPTTPPDPPRIGDQPPIAFVAPGDILSFRALPHYHEPEWVTADFVDQGLLPPVEQRLPKEPLVYRATNMPDGIGVYGDALRQITGGSPEGWNYMAGQSQGWGGVDIATMECLTRTGPLFQVRADALEPLPNLARSWEWSPDGHRLTMHLIKGARWSDGVPFTSDDVMFYWNDNVLDPNVVPLSGTTGETFGAGTTLRAIDDYTIEWTFTQAFPVGYLYQMAYPDFCPGPAHIFRPLHPRYNPKATYESYKNSVPPDYLNIPVMGAWVPVAYRPNEDIVMRRNPYYWKVDEAGNQLPYLDELQYRLSSWEARDIETAAGTADFTNLEQPANYVEVLKRSANPASPVVAKFGLRTSAYSLLMNMSANGWGQPDRRGQAMRELNRNLDFRKGVTTALDRRLLGDALVKGPFTAIYPGGLQSGTTFYDKPSTAYFPPSPSDAKAYFARAGLTDPDADGWLNWPAGAADSGDVVVTLLVASDSDVDRTLAESVSTQLENVGLRVVLQVTERSDKAALERAGRFDWVISRNGPELATVVQGATALAPTGPKVHEFHQAGPDGTLDLMPFEQQLVDIVESFLATSDPLQRAALMRTYQKTYTENVYAIGLTEFPGAVIVNKRFANVPPDVPVFLFNWAEDAIMRERMYVPRDRQLEDELYPDTLPGPPGGDGPVKGR